MRQSIVTWTAAWAATVCCAWGHGQGQAQVAPPHPTSGATSNTWGGYAVSEPVPYQPSIAQSAGPLIEPSCESSSALSSAVPPGSEPWQIYPVTPPPNTPVVTIPAPGDVQFPQPEVSPSGMKPWFPPGGRQTFFQKVKLTGDYLPRFSDESLGMTDAELDVVFALPFFTVETPLLITPFYGIHFMDGPVTPDVPPRLHDAAVTFQNVRPLNDHWMALIDVTLGQYADDASFDSSEAFRITGGGAGVYRSSDRWKWVLGATYVNRASTQILPVAGFIYTPNDDAEYNLVFPVPKLAWRLPWSDNPGTDDRWFYLGGEFGGGAWAVRREDGTEDRLDITDWRIYLGLERRIVGGLSRRVELGYVFSRKLEYQDPLEEFELEDTLMVRGGLTY